MIRSSSSIQRKIDGRYSSWLPSLSTAALRRGVFTCTTPDHLASEETVRDHLKEAGVRVKSVKFGESLFTSSRCDFILESFIVTMTEAPKRAIPLQTLLRDACGIHIEI